MFGWWRNATESDNFLKMSLGMGKCNTLGKNPVGNGRTEIVYYWVWMAVGNSDQSRYSYHRQIAKELSWDYCSGFLEFQIWPR